MLSKGGCVYRPYSFIRKHIVTKQEKTVSCALAAAARSVTMMRLRGGATTRTVTAFWSSGLRPARCSINITARHVMPNENPWKSPKNPEQYRFFFFKFWHTYILFCLIKKVLQTELLTHILLFGSCICLSVHFESLHGIAEATSRKTLKWYESYYF